jgi:uncharacterized protein (UPF0276 family)
MSTAMADLGLGIGWRPELALAIERRADLGFVELLAEDCFAAEEVPPAITALSRRDVKIVPHGVSLSLGSAEPIERWRVDALAHLAEEVCAPLVSEHLAFVRGGGLETGHLLPLPRTRDMVKILVENIRQAEEWLPVPLALENIAALFDWPGAEMDEAAFLTAILADTEALLLLDLENVYANARNHGGNALEFLEHIPLDRVAYVHVAGGVEMGGLWLDTHAESIPDEVLSLVEEVCARTALPGAMLERDDRFPSEAELNAELDTIAAAKARGKTRRLSQLITAGTHP